MRSKDMRINKYLSDIGICSRREADRLVSEGRITINGSVAQMGDRVGGDDTVQVDGKVVSGRESDEKVIIAYNKPRGIVCTSEKREKHNIINAINYPVRIYPIGRLDKDSNGLILLTNDGSVVNRLMRARYHHEKEYEVTVDKAVDDEFIKSMSNGVPILDTVTRPCKVRKTGDKSFNIILTQGLNRQIRRMCAEFGYRVEDLLRIRVVNLQLGDLKEGDIRQADESEIRGLRAALEKEDGRNAKKDNGISKRGSAQYD